MNMSDYTVNTNAGQGKGAGKNLTVTMKVSHAPERLLLSQARCEQMRKMHDRVRKGKADYARRQRGQAQKHGLAAWYETIMREKAFTFDVVKDIPRTIEAEVTIDQAIDVLVKAGVPRDKAEALVREAMDKNADAQAEADAVDAEEAEEEEAEDK